LVHGDKSGKEERTGKTKEDLKEKSGNEDAQAGGVVMHCL
jgi:hypothetical protein